MQNTATQTKVKVYETQVNIYNKDYFVDYYLDLLNFKRYILNCITEDYDGNELTTQKEKLTFVVDCFKSEYCHEYNLIRYRHNYTTLFAEWLQGLPSAITTIFYYSDIINLFKSLEVQGSCYQDMQEREQDEILQEFFNVCSVVFMELLNDNEIKL